MDSITSYTIDELVNTLEQIMGEWDGDNSGIFEDRATIAEMILTKVEEIIELSEEL